MVLHSILQFRLSPLLFLTDMKEISYEHSYSTSHGLPWEVLYADDLALTTYRPY